MGSYFDARELRASWRAWVRHDLQPPGPRWMQWLWTALLSIALAAIFTVLAMLTVGARSNVWAEPARWAPWFGRNLVISATIAALVHLLFDLFAPWARPRVPRWNALQRALFFSSVPLAGVAMGWPLALWLLGVDLNAVFGSGGNRRLVLSSVALSCLACFVMYQFFGLKARQFVAEQRATEAQLRLLQAQIEPHFLFNTLANVHSLIEHDATRARSMLGAFTDYLRASLAELRREQVTLADELALAEAYLRVQATRMEDRLSYRIEADEVARRATLPPLLLQPLVENAVLHGLEPQIAGGSIQVRARAEAGMLVVEVRDDGRGPGTPVRRGAGVGLVNVRERLAARFGKAASLALSAAEPGTLATLRLPIVAEAPR